MTIRKIFLAVSVGILSPLIFSGMSFALNPRISVDNQSSTLNEGSSEVITVTLNEPIICEQEDAPCNVVLNYTSSDPASISMAGSTITWTTSDWYAPMQINVTALAPSNCANTETDTISATAVSNSEYYSNFQSSFNVTVNSQPPYVAPGISNSTINVVNNGNSVNTNVTAGAINCPDATSLTILSGPSHGSAVDPIGSITYTPNAGYYGTDSLVYNVCSLLDNTVCTSATLTYNITGDPTDTIPKSPDTGYGLPAKSGSLIDSLGVISVLMLGTGLMLIYRARVSNR